MSKAESFLIGVMALPSCRSAAGRPEAGQHLKSGATGPSSHQALGKGAKLKLPFVTSSTYRAVYTNIAGCDNSLQTAADNDTDFDNGSATRTAPPAVRPPHHPRFRGVAGPDRLARMGADADLLALIGADGCLDGFEYVLRSSEADCTGGLQDSNVRYYHCPH